MANIKSDYKKAMSRPTGKNGRGWKYADDDSMAASYAEILGHKFCMRPDAIYAWAKKHNVDLLKNWTRLYQQKVTDVFADDSLVILVLNDLSLIE